MVLEKTLESPLDSKEIQPVNPKGNQPCVSTGRTEAEAPVIWLPDGKIWLVGKDPGAGKDWRQEKGATGWDTWMASPTQWTWVWANSRRWWRTGKLDVLQSTSPEKFEHDLVTKKQLAGIWIDTRDLHFKYFEFIQFPCVSGRIRHLLLPSPIVLNHSLGCYFSYLSIYLSIHHLLLEFEVSKKQYSISRIFISSVSCRLSSMVDCSQILGECLMFPQTQ